MCGCSCPVIVPTPEVALRRHRYSIALAAAAALVLGLVAVPAVGGASPTGSPNLVIAQVYGGGGNSGAPYNADYIELFNRSSTSASLGGLSLQYASATGTANFGSSSSTVPDSDVPDETGK